MTKNNNNLPISESAAAELLQELEAVTAGIREEIAQNVCDELAETGKDALSVAKEAAKEKDTKPVSAAPMKLVRKAVTEFKPIYICPMNHWETLGKVEVSVTDPNSTVCGKFRVEESVLSYISVTCPRCGRKMEYVPDWATGIVSKLLDKGYKEVRFDCNKNALSFAFTGDEMEKMWKYLTHRDFKWFFRHIYYAFNRRFKEIDVVTSGLCSVLCESKSTFVRQAILAGHKGMDFVVEVKFNIPTNKMLFIDSDIENAMPDFKVTYAHANNNEDAVDLVKRTIMEQQALVANPEFKTDKWLQTKFKNNEDFIRKLICK